MLNTSTWLFDLIDNKLIVKDIKIICDEEDVVLCGVLVDKDDNVIQLSSHDARIVLGIFADRSHVSVNELIDYKIDSFLKVIKIKRNDFIKKIIIINGNKNIYRMVITNGDNIEKEIINKEKQQEILKVFANQKGLDVSKINDLSFDDLVVINFDSLITNIDVIVDEWKINTGPFVEKIIVTFNNGKKYEYSDISLIKKYLLDLIKQEYIDDNDYNKRVNTLKNASRVNMINCLLGIKKVNIIRPIYKKIEILELKDMLPTKVRILTINHGEQIYDLVVGKKVYDSNFINKKCIFDKCFLEENDDCYLGVYEVEKHNELLLRKNESFENHFFVTYFAKQELLSEGLMKQEFDNDKLLEKQKQIVSDVSKVCLNSNYEENKGSILRKSL